MWVYEVKFFDWRPQKKVRILVRFGPKWSLMGPKKRHSGIWLKWYIHMSSFSGQTNFGHFQNLSMIFLAHLGKTWRPQKVLKRTKNSQIFFDQQIVLMECFMVYIQIFGPPSISKPAWGFQNCQKFAPWAPQNQKWAPRAHWAHPGPNPIW